MSVTKEDESQAREPSLVTLQRGLWSTLPIISGR